ncbi:hypothetical protein [Spiroplasma endosymbiont of Cantharis rufa]|uniref:hypothetical protein n=1 Tax=Spiroplasma endosymbiont of Cantharis rufa TaxID=3066279 RepID=UPI0030D5673A
MNKIFISLSRSGKSLDNIACEAFLSSLKTEWHQKNLNSFQEVYNNVLEWI